MYVVFGKSFLIFGRFYVNLELSDARQEIRFSLVHKGWALGVSNLNLEKSVELGLMVVLWPLVRTSVCEPPFNFTWALPFGKASPSFEFDWREVRSCDKVFGVEEPVLRSWVILKFGRGSLVINKALGKGFGRNFGVEF